MSVQPVAALPLGGRAGTKLPRLLLLLLPPPPLVSPRPLIARRPPQSKLAKLNHEHRELKEKLREERKQAEELWKSKTQLEDERRLQDRTVEQMQRKVTPPTPLKTPHPHLTIPRGNFTGTSTIPPPSHDRMCFCYICSR